MYGFTYPFILRTSYENFAFAKQIIKYGSKIQVVFKIISTFCYKNKEFSQCVLGYTN